MVFRREFVRSLSVIVVAAFVLGACGGGEQSASVRQRNTSSCYASETERQSVLDNVTAAIQRVYSAQAALPTPTALEQKLQEINSRYSSEGSKYSDLYAQWNEVRATGTQLRIVNDQLRLTNNLTEADEAKLNNLIAEDNRLRSAISTQAALMSSIWNEKTPVEADQKQHQYLDNEIEVLGDQLRAASETPLCESAQTSVGSATESTVAAETSSTVDGATESTAAAETSSTVDGATESNVAAETSTTVAALVSDESGDSTLAPVQDGCPPTAAVAPQSVMVGEDFQIQVPGCVSTLTFTAQTFDLVTVVSSDGEVHTLKANQVGTVVIAVKVTNPAASQPPTERLVVTLNIDILPAESSSSGADKCEGTTPEGSLEPRKVLFYVTLTCEAAVGFGFQVYSGGVAVYDYLYPKPSEAVAMTRLLSAYPKIDVRVWALCAQTDGSIQNCGNPLVVDGLTLPESEPSAGATNPCLDLTKPNYACGWAAVDDEGRVTNVFRCDYSRCGTGIFGDWKVVLQTRGDDGGKVCLYGATSAMRYDRNQNIFYPRGIPGPWFTGGDSCMEANESLIATMPTSEATPATTTTSTTTLPATTTSVATGAPATTTVQAASTNTSSSTTTSTTTLPTTTTSVPPSGTSDNATINIPQPSAVVVPLPVALLRPESATDETTATPLPIPVNDEATVMVCEETCLSEARSVAGADADATVEIEVAQDLWVLADGATIPVNPSGAPLRMRVSPVSGLPVVISGNVASASQVIAESNAQANIELSPDGNVIDSDGDLLQVVPLPNAADESSRVLTLVLGFLALGMVGVLLFILLSFLKRRR